ncbi:NUMOD4 domain-containing protein [Clostridium perfringens]|nr:NUMOD4 domain-containing protein [Clostridium perfringens]MDK0786787.1 NUMOD4 domain-containing protein [Clostridium perfringens]
MKGLWIDITGYNGTYQVINFGNIRSTNYMKTERIKILKLRKDKDGYLQINLCFKGKRKTAKVHRSVSRAFLENPNSFFQVNNKGEDKTNNKVSNLKCCKRIYNTSGEFIWRYEGDFV